MTRVRALFACLLLATVAHVTAQQVTPVEPPVDRPEGPRSTDAPVFSYEDLAEWIVATRPEVARRPMSLGMVFDRTDSVWGTGTEKDVLPTVWRRDLLGGILQNFLVEGVPSRDLQGDRVSILGFGRRELSTIVVDESYARSAAARLKEAYPRPYVDTPRELGGTFLNARFAEAVDNVERLHEADNELVLFVTDDIAQGGDAGGPASAVAFRTYRASLQEGGERVFTVYLYANGFPNATEFLRYDDDVRAFVPETRTERADEQARGRQPELECTTARPCRPPGMGTGLPVAGLVAVSVALLVLAILFLLLRAWASERYWVRDERGQIDRAVYVWPSRSKRVGVPHPRQPEETIGHLYVQPKLPFGLSRLRFAPSPRYRVSAAGRSADRGATGGSHATPRLVTLRAALGKPTRNVLRFIRAASGASSPQMSENAGNEVGGEVTLHVQRSYGRGGRSAKRRRRKKGDSRPSKAPRRRRVDLTQGLEGEER